MHNTLLRTRDLTLQRHGQTLVNAINLDLDRRSLTMVMGANGAGKSLLVRMLHGLILPTSGTITWDEIPMSDTVRKSQAMVFQRPVLLRRSVAANIHFALKASSHNLSKAQRSTRTDELLHTVGLHEHHDQPARLLSGGEQQRLALARALATTPQTLFLDEPTASLDPASALQIENIVADVHKSGTKIIFISHDVGQARRLAQDIVFLHGGHLAEHTPATSFFTAPKSPSAQAYLEGRLMP